MKKIILKIDAVIFDMDGVITNTMPDHFRAWHKIFDGYGIHVSHHDVYAREGQRGIHSVVEIFGEHKKMINIMKAKKILAAKEKLFKEIAKTRFIPGARRFLQYLSRKNFKLALVTGTARHEVHKILPRHLYDLFSVIVTGSDVKNGKPHPEPFLLALKKLSVSPKRAVVIENAPFGIKSAKKAGLKCFALETSLNRSFLAEADAVFLSVRDLLKRVELKAINRT